MSAEGRHCIPGKKWLLDASYSSVYLIGLIKSSIAGEVTICTSEEDNLSGGIFSAVKMFKSNRRQVFLCSLFHPGGMATVKKECWLKDIIDEAVPHDEKVPGEIPQVDLPEDDDSIDESTWASRTLWYCVYCVCGILISLLQQSTPLCPVDALNLAFVYNSIGYPGCQVVSTLLSASLQISPFSSCTVADGLSNEISTIKIDFEWQSSLLRVQRQFWNW